MGISIFWQGRCAITAARRRNRMRPGRIRNKWSERMSVVLGIDGGGTRTRATIVEGERALAFAESGSIKRLRVGATAAEENLRALLGEVFQQAGLKGVQAA